MSDFALLVTDGLGHDLPAMTAEVRREMLLGWFELEDALGDELSPDLRELRDRLRADEEANL